GAAVLLGQRQLLGRVLGRQHLRVLRGRDAEAVLVAVVVGDEELRLPVVAVRDLRDGEAHLRQSHSQRANVAWRPVETDTVVFGWRRLSVATLVEPRVHMLIVYHAPDE